MAEPHLSPEWGFPPPPPPPPGLSCEMLQCPSAGWAEGGTAPHGARLPPLPVVAVCSSVLLVALLVAAFLLWRHKRKVQSSPPCKPDQPEESTPGYGESLLTHRPPGLGPLLPLEILDSKLSSMGPQLPTLPHPPFYPPRDAGHLIGGTSPNPVYEEVSPALVNSIAPGQILRAHNLSSGADFNEDEFMSREDSGQCSATSSVRGSTGGDLSRDPVSSDDDEYKAGMLPSDTTFGFPRKLSRPDAVGKNHNSHQMAHPERTLGVASPDRKINGEMHPKRNFTAHPAEAAYPYYRGHLDGRWPKQDGHRNYVPDASQENIYSTIDEDELVDFPVYHHSPSLAAAQRGSLLNSAKRTPFKGGQSIPPLSQRNAEENCASYGDMQPAYGSSAFL